MIIVADSGSSKTDWRLITSIGGREALQTAGLNPNVTSKDNFKSVIQNSELLNWSSLAIERVYFYSAGITGRDMQEKLAGWLRPFFKKAQILTDSDLLGAARAVYGYDTGMIGILGTGSNSGYFNGHEIKEHIPPLGYLLGDEGSGNALGKRLITLFLRNELPPEIETSFKAFYPEYQSLLNNVYADDQPAKFLASFVPFIIQYKNHPIIMKLIHDEFARYFNLIKNGYQGNRQVGLVGSIAYYFREGLEKEAKRFGIKLSRILKSPIEALTLYHQTEIS